MADNKPPALTDPKTGERLWREASESRMTREMLERELRDPGAQIQAAPGKKDNEQERAVANFQTLTRYATRLRTAIQGRGYLVDPDFSLSQDPDAVEKMLRDPMVNFAVNFRKRLVAGREWSLRAKVERYKRFVEPFTDLLERMEGFNNARFMLAEAVFQGVAAARIDGGTEYAKLQGTNRWMEWWLPRRLVHVDKRRLRKEFMIRHRDDGRAQYFYAWTIYDPEQGKWYVITRPDWYVWFKYNDEEDRLGHGRGLYDALWNGYHARTLLREYGLRYSERHADPWVDVALGAEAGDSEALTTRGEAYIDLFKKMRAAGVIYHDSRDVTKLMEAGGSTQSIIDRMLEREEKGIILVCLANVLTTGTGDHGSRASAEVHEDSQTNAVMHDQMLECETITRDVLGPTWRSNRANLLAMGEEDVPWDCPLEFELQHEQKWDVQEQVAVFDLADRLGVAVQEKDFRQRFGLADVSPGDRRVRGAQAAPAGGGFGFSALDLALAEAAARGGRSLKIGARQ